MMISFMSLIYIVIADHSLKINMNIEGENDNKKYNIILKHIYIYPYYKEAAYFCSNIHMHSSA